MIDTTTIKVGDKVRLRNGSIKTVMEIKIDGHIDYPVDITFVGKKGYRTSYAPSGKFYVGRKDPWDILEIIPAETSEEEPSKDDDWDDLKRSKLMDAIEEWDPGEKPVIIMVQ